MIVAKTRAEKPVLSEYSNDYIPMREVLEEMVFVPFEEEDWEEMLPGYREEALSAELAGKLLTDLGIADYIDYKENVAGRYVTREEWKALYRQIRDYLDTDMLVQEQRVMVLESIASEDGCILVTSEGDYTADFAADYLEKWKNFDLYVQGERCIGIAGHASEPVRLQNAMQKRVTESELTFLYRGSEYHTAAEGLEDNGCTVCDLEFADGVLIKKYEKKDTIEGELLSYDEQTIEISGYEKVQHDKELPVYQVYGETQEKSLSDIVLGNMKVKYVVAEERVCAILLVEPADIQKIRVLLLGDGGQIGRENVCLKTSEECRVICGANEATVAGGTVLHASDYGLSENGQTLCVTPATETGTISFCDETGVEQGNPYAGKMEVRCTEEGYTVVNELPLEEYLCAVVPSEMPSTFGMEALKAQAVCARSYAYIQLLRADYASRGAHIDDSTSYQVYNKTARTEQSIRAVNETMGQVMTYAGNVIEAYYFSTSGGYTDTIGVWNRADDGTYGYLKKVCLNAEECQKDLSVEENFREYIMSAPAGYESGINFYRWSAKAAFSGKESELASVLKTRKGIAPENIVYYGSDGSTEVETMDSFGALNRVLVTQRSASGSILNLRLEYENGMVDVKTEYNIRRVLGVGAGSVVLADEKERDMTLLPSAFCAVIPLEDGTYKIYGGGYGHGLGMSQNGANSLAAEGKNYQDILAFFYRDVVLSNIYEKEQ